MGEVEMQQANATLLIVDDESNILSSLRRLFRPTGYRIITASSAAEGLEILESEAVDLIISDMRMPEMDGAQFLAIAAKKWPDVIRILLTGYADLSSAIQAINEGSIYKYISKPWEENDLKTSVRNALERKQLLQERDRLQALTAEQNEQLKVLNASLEDKVRERTAELRQAHTQLESAYSNLKHSYGATVKMFANLLEVRGGTMTGHSRSVADKAYHLAIKLGVDKNDLQDILFAGMLHDMGYLALPDRLANAPFYSLSKDERATVAEHPIIAEAAIMSIEPMQGAAKIIRHHHELFDGRGYPDGLSGKDIPLGARILAVVDEFDGLQKGILKTQKMSAQEACEYLRRHAHVRYDPVIVETFLKEFAEYSDIGPIERVDQDRSLRSGDLQEGMIISRDLIVRNGVLLLSRGHVLDIDLIDKIRRFERSFDEQFKIYVMDESLE